MILEIKEFRERVKSELSGLVGELQAVTGRLGDEEKQSWCDSHPLLAKAFSAPGFDPLHLYFNGTGALSLEYQLPAAASWCDVVLLGNTRPIRGVYLWFEDPATRAHVENSLQ